MLFNSYSYLFLFLPTVLLLYFLLNRLRLFVTARLFLVVASLFFYTSSHLAPLVRLVGLSMVFNYFVGRALSRSRESEYLWGLKRAHVLYLSVAVNIASLVYFKYTGFLIDTINTLLGQTLPMLHILLPLGISFFTFQEIAYLVDSFRGKTRDYNFLNYALFVSFFPQLIAGPIVHHKEEMAQFEDPTNRQVNFDNISLGIFFLAIGLFKKVVIADTFAVWATHGFDLSASPHFLEAWAISLSYTMQLYFDFSGYTDMAIGSALMFNIRLPFNFNSPYKALNIQDFWRRWHMTLSRFLRDYLYIPLGGNRGGEFLTARNVLLVFLIGGIWHGAGWTFFIWGLLHGGAMVCLTLWDKTKIHMPKILAWLITFNFINVTWVFFRAHDFHDAFKVLRGMAGLNGVELPLVLEPFLGKLSLVGVEFGTKILEATGAYASYQVVIWLILAFVTVLFFKNSQILAERFRPTVATLGVVVLLLLVSLYSLGEYSEFIYFRF